MRFPTAGSELERWVDSPHGVTLELAYMTCFLLGSLQRSSSVYQGNFRWIANASKVIVAGLKEFEAALRFERVDEAHIFDSPPLRQLLRDLTSSGIVDECCARCGEPFAQIVGERIAPWEHGVMVPRCRRCGDAYDYRTVIYRLSDSGFDWLEAKLEPLLRTHELAIMSKTQVLSSRLRFRDEISQFDLASDLSLKLSELADLRPPVGHTGAEVGNVTAPMNEI